MTNFINGHPKLSLEKVREALSNTLSKVQNTGGATGPYYVLQLPSGQVYTDKAGSWTYLISDARSFQQTGAAMFGGQIVTVEVARAPTSSPH